MEECINLQYFSNRHVLVSNQCSKLSETGWYQGQEMFRSLFYFRMNNLVGEDRHINDFIAVENDRNKWRGRNVGDIHKNENIPKLDIEIKRTAFISNPSQQGANKQPSNNVSEQLWMNWVWMSGPRVHQPAAGAHRVVTSGAQKEILVQGKDSMKKFSALLMSAIGRYYRSSHHTFSGFRKEGRSLCIGGQKFFSLQAIHSFLCLPVCLFVSIRSIL
jgi:hypothetical protein